MGERVYVRPHEPRGQDPFVEPEAGVPLDYHQDTRADRWRQWRATVTLLGGYRQIGFAVGLGFVLAAAGAALRSDEASFFGFVGGVLIGLCVRVPRWRDD